MTMTSKKIKRKERAELRKIKPKLKKFAFDLSSSQDRVEYAQVIIEAENEEEARKLYHNDESEYWMNAKWIDADKGGEINVELEDVYEKTKENEGRQR